MALGDALAGMSPQQAQAAMGVAIKALGQKQQRELQTRQLDLQEQQQEGTQEYRQRRLDILRDRETRLKNAAQAERDMKQERFKLDKKLGALDRKLRTQQIQSSNAQKKLLIAKREEIEDKKSAIDNLKQEFKLPGTDEKITAGAAIRAGIFGDVLENNLESKRLGLDDTPADFKNVILLERRGIPFQEAVRKVYGSDIDISDLIRLTTSLSYKDEKETRESVKNLFEILRSTQGGQYNSQGTRTARPEINIELDTSKNPLE